MSKITRDSLAAVRADMDAALAAVARKHGLRSLRCTGTTYDPRSGNFVTKVEGVAKDGMSKEAARYEQSRESDDSLPPIGYVFKNGGYSYSVSGMNSTGSKVIATRLNDDRQFLFQRDALKRLCLRATKNETGILV